jgi:phosphate:Na+ symporter
MIILPFTSKFARFMERLIPERVTPYTRTLDSSLLEDTGLALNAAQSAISSITIALFSHVSAILGDREGGALADLDELQSALNDTHDFIDRTKPESPEGADWE